MSDYPTLQEGDEGPLVTYMQSLLPHSADGDFGPITKDEVEAYQKSRGLKVDGIVGEQTWDALENEAPPVRPEPLPGEMPVAMQKAIREIAKDSDIFGYGWKDRGVAPPGYTEGMALAFAQTYMKLKEGDSSAEDMAKANTHNADYDALSWYAGTFNDMGMPNEQSGPDTLRHLYVLLLGLGMRESSGRHCEGRDMSASNVSSDTCEAGLFQTSYNAHSSSDEFDKLFDEYSAGQPCYLGTFEQGVSCGESEWDCYGSGNGYKFQELCKSCPTFAVETCAITLRNLRQHYGPINRREAEIKTEADTMFHQVQEYVDEMEAVA